MAKTDGLIFGRMVIEGKKYRRDVLIFVDDTVKKRTDRFLMFGSREIKELEL